MSSSVFDWRVEALVDGAVVRAPEGAVDGAELDGVIRCGISSDVEVSVARCDTGDEGGDGALAWARLSSCVGGW